MIKLELETFDIYLTFPYFECNEVYEEKIVELQPLKYFPTPSRYSWIKPDNPPPGISPVITSVIKKLREKHVLNYMDYVAKDEGAVTMSFADWARKNRNPTHVPELTTPFEETIKQIKPHKKSSSKICGCFSN